ncbi:MAG TPA: hypothetical protein VD994_03115 [Prosthecobacter sp.]|nr:hypothetical protein [Prosthecobacter sp.]
MLNNLLAGGSAGWNPAELAAALRPDWELLDRHHWHRDLQAHYGAELDDAALEQHAELALAVLGEHPETLRLRRPSGPATDGARPDYPRLAQAIAPLFARPPVGPLPPGAAPRFKQPKPRIGGKEGSKDIPSWARGRRPQENENGDQYARRLMDEQYGKDKWTPKDREFRLLKKFGDRSFNGLPVDWLDEEDEDFI